MLKDILNLCSSLKEKYQYYDDDYVIVELKKIIKKELLRVYSYHQIKDIVDDVIEDLIKGNISYEDLTTFLYLEAKYAKYRYTKAEIVDENSVSDMDELFNKIEIIKDIIERRK